MTAPRKDVPRRLRRLLVVTALLGGTLWFVFIDNYNLVRRIGWHQEAARLTAENEALRRQIDTLEARLAEPISDEVIERIAREQYRMRRPGETVYRVD